MQTIKQLVQAIGTGLSAPFGGRAFLIQSCDAGNTLTVTLTDKQGKQYIASDVGAGFKAIPRGGFTHVDMTTTADANVAFIVADGDIDLQNSQVNVIVANPNPIQVDIAGGSVNVTASNVGINNTEANPVPVKLTSSDDATAIPVSLPALPAGANAIGTVGVTALPALPAGANAIGTVGVTALPALPAGANAIGTVGVTALPALPAGANAIGTVGVTSLPALPAGANTIGNVNVVDALAARSIAGTAYAGLGVSPVGSAACSRVQLWNPIGSGVSLYVEQVAAVQNTTEAIYLSFNTAALSTLCQQGQNKKAGGATAKGAIYADTSGSSPVPSTSFGIVSGPASISLAQYPSADPIVIPPGNGLVLWCNTTNQQIVGVFEWYEQ